MNLSLFGQNFALVLFGLVVGLSLFVYTKIDSKLRYKAVGIVTLFALILSGILEFITSWITQSGDELPPKLWLMIFPFAFAIGLIGILIITSKITTHREIDAKKKNKKKAVTEPAFNHLFIYSFATINIAICLLFTLLMVNDYYRYYPTLATVFDIGKARTTVLSSQNKILLQYGQQSLSQNKNIESSIYSTNKSTINGKLYSLAIPGTVSKFKARSGYVYVPSVAYNATNLVKLPVLIMLPGSPGTPSDLPYPAGLLSTLSNFAAEHHGITPLVYVADDDGTQFNDTECVNSPRGNVETYLSVDVPNYIKHHFDVSTNPSNWAIGGISMGGMCGVMLTLTHPDVYHYFVDIGGEDEPEIGPDDTTISQLFGGSTYNWDMHQPLYLLQKNKYTGIGGFFGDGNSDTPDVVIGTKQLYMATKQDGFDVVQETVQGSHTFNIFSKLINDSMPWISNRIGATECTEADSLLCQ